MTLGYEDVEFLDLETEDQEDEAEEYEEEELPGSVSSGPEIVFDEEIRKVLNQEPAWIGQIPKWYMAEDGTRFMFSTPRPDDVELEVSGSQENLRKCFDCGWSGVISMESEGEKMRDYAPFCPNCGRQTLRTENDE